LNMILEIKREKIDWELPVIATEAINNKNTDRLLEKIAAHIEYEKSSGRFENRRREQIRKKIYSILQYHLSNLIKDKLNGLVNLDKIVSDIYEGKSDPYTISQKLLELSDLKSDRK